MQPAVFLDRDGVLNKRHFPVVRRPDQLVLLPGLGEAAARLSKAGYALCIATNQELVGHGYITRADHDEVMRLCVAALESEGAKVTGVYACVHPRGSGCDDQKPKPGMLLQAAREHGLDLARSFMVGDQRKDMQAGRAAGCRTVLVDPRLRTRLQGAERYADHVCADLPAAASWILAQG
ncbi:MAG: D-glycero-D-manno-heptose 1,7-bisphosphate phosphatase [Thermoplasmata archaeon]|jgi:histidinol-phosphate phosphatase family protein|nr:D-glycero-D-manno-heptose 1,7-bisphosphate phosphatase [Thermoplasmata archaeon]